jgi:protein-disulfide isomerase
MEKNQNKITIYLSVIVAVLVIGVAIFYALQKGGVSNSGLAKATSTPTSALEAQGLSFDGLPLLGNPNATTTILEFGDFQCIACVQFFATAEPQITKDLIDTGKANMVFKILDFIGPESVDAAEAAECSADQGKFWEMHDAIYNAELNEAKANKSNENSGNLTKNFFVSTAKNLGMDVNQFTSCYDSQKYASKIASFYTDAGKALGGSISTPSVFVIKNGVGQKVANPFDVSSFEGIVNQ